MAIKTYADFQKYNFFRPPSWRWDRVLSLIDNKSDIPGRCTKRDDAIVKTTRNFVLRWRNGSREMREKLLWENPGLFYAYDFQQRLMDDPEAAMYIEARLLARQTPEQISDIMGVMPEAVQWYADLFFDVIPYLERRDWITKQILVPAILRSPVKAPEETNFPNFKDSTVAKPFLDGSLKVFAYFGGTHLVDLLIYGMQAGKPVTSPDEIKNWLDNNINMSIRRRAAQAAMLFEVNKYNVMELFATHTKIMEIERSDDSESKTKSTQERHITAMLDDLPWAVGDDGATLYEGTMVGRFDKMSSELRDDELLLLGSGRAAPSIKDNFPKELPPPRKNKKAILTAEEAKLS